MLAGRLWPQLGGDPKYLDLMGVNYYYNNQRVHGVGMVTDRRSAYHRPLRSTLEEVYARYRCTMFMAETGIEGQAHVNGRPLYVAPILPDEDARQQELFTALRSPAAEPGAGRRIALGSRRSAEAGTAGGRASRRGSYSRRSGRAPSAHSRGPPLAAERPQPL